MFKINDLYPKVLISALYPEVLILDLLVILPDNLFSTTQVFCLNWHHTFRNILDFFYEC